MKKLDQNYQEYEIKMIVNTRVRQLRKIMSDRETMYCKSESECSDNITSDCENTHRDCGNS
jgi:hypothetical protein